MCRLWWTTCVSLFMWLSIIPAYAQTVRKSADSAQVTGVLDRLLDALNGRDPAKFAAQFTEDADFVDARGAHVHGRKAIADMAEKQIKQHRTGSRARRLDVAVKSIRPDVAVAMSSLALADGHATAKSGRVLATFVMVKAGGQWRINVCEIATGPMAPGK